MNKSFEAKYKRLQQPAQYAKELKKADELTQFRTQRAFDNANRIKVPVVPIGRKGW